MRVHLEGGQFPHRDQTQVFPVGGNVTVGEFGGQGTSGYNLTVEHDLDLVNSTLCGFEGHVSLAVAAAADPGLRARPWAGYLYGDTAWTS